jgi:hypothetical protein
MDDDVIPFGYGKKLASLRPDAVFYPVKGADHVDVLGLRDTEIEQAITEIVRNLPKPKA